MIYISTGGFKDNTSSKSISNLLKNGINSIELSGGKFEDFQIDKLKKFKNSNKNLSLQVHNYFPPPEKPFVFNLGSLDTEISTKSLDHAINSINLVSSLGGNYYSFHAGFLLDPKVNELGKKIKKRVIYNRDKSIRNFISRVNKLSDIASKKNITLLIENNVLSLNNFKEFGQNVLLMVDKNECLEIMNEINQNNVRMLIDVAHLKVSANSLRFNPVIFLSSLEKWIAGYHFSDNNGTSDDNQKFTKDSWFWPYIKKDLDYYTIEVYNSSIKELIKQKDLASHMIYK